MGTGGSSITVLQSRGKKTARCNPGHVFIPGDLRCLVCLAVHLPLDWAALGLGSGSSLWPPVLVLQRLQGSPQVHKGLGYCP